MFTGLKVLTVIALGVTENENSGLTINSIEVEMCNAHDAVRQGLPCKRAELLFKSGSEAEIWVSDYDLMKIQEAIGTYGFED